MNMMIGATHTQTVSTMSNRVSNGLCFHSMGSLYGFSLVYCGNQTHSVSSIMVSRAATAFSLRFSATAFQNFV